MRGARPDVQLLANGDILVPVEDEHGQWRMSRVVLDDAEYADWLRVVQDGQRGPGFFAQGVSFWMSAVTVLVGLWVLVVIAALVARAL